MMSTEQQGELQPYRRNIASQRWLVAVDFILNKISARLALRFGRNRQPPSLASAAVKDVLQQRRDDIQQLEVERQRLQSQADLLGNKLLPAFLLAAAAFAGWTVLSQLWMLINGGDFNLSFFMSVLSPFFWAIMLAVGISYLSFAGSYLNYIDNCKQRLIPLLLTEFGKLDYQRYGAIPIQPLAASGILPPHNGDVFQEDYIVGYYRQCHFQVSHAEFYGRQRGHQRARKKFHGLMLYLAAPTGFEGVTTLVQQRTLASRFKLTTDVANTEQVFLEDADFNQRFTVYSTDQIAARAWLTPALMQRLLSLSDQYADAGIAVSMFNQQVLLLLNTDQPALTTPDSEIAVADLPFCGQLHSELQNIFTVLELLQSSRS
ncbi:MULTISPECIES: DUF3137 domain-containing protein [unclassified Halomonas]|nr:MULTISPECIES: DUF3137 domain-containing protein [unclassified Halomonas]MBT2786348.1 DUF3137 domain-containing protein [Halomonas sp. ISL-106]MBT2797370.1 DUF3137 domain-containing protein [Halomonas sp. ISL-104]